MSISIDSRLWLATHLLYPNSSQAFDVYQSLLAQSETSIKKNKTGYFFQKLAQIADKIPAVNSNKAFHVFENKQTDQWQMIYKKSQKDQMMIFLGILIFEMSIQDISGILKISYEKARFLFHQTFKKSIVTISKMKIADKIELKKFNEEKVSFLFTNENLIDYCLKTLTAAEMKKVTIGLQLYPELQAAHQHYSAIVNQIHELLDDQAHRVTEPLIQVNEALAVKPQSAFNLRQAFSMHRKLIAAVSLSALFLILVTIRPEWMQQITQKTRDRFVILQEIKPQPMLPDDFHSETPTLALNELPVQSVLQDKKNTQAIPTHGTSPSFANLADTKAKPVKEVVDTAKPVAQIPVKVAEVKAPAIETVAAVSPKKMGGLYRGVLTVTDINEVTSKITQKIVNVGGKKAGEVELGWRKSDKLSYYHFTLPENNIDSVKEFLSKFGKLQIQFENHPRLMPAGVKRLIIEVKERE